MQLRVKECSGGRLLPTMQSAGLTTDMGANPLSADGSFWEAAKQ